ncbi:pyridoxal phosphate-dependent transferase, partial [Blyttiomyces helicus]
AHSVGTYGPGGRGLVSELGLESRVFARLNTFGKGLGNHGANLSLLSTLPRAQDLILLDSLCHASTHDGAKLSRARSRRTFAHSDVADLERILTGWFEGGEEKGEGEGDGRLAVVAVESVYSMDGDVAPLEEILGVVEGFGGRVALIVDE